MAGLSEAVRGARQRAGMSLSELARASYCDLSTIKAIEAGEYLPDPPLREMLAGVLGDYEAPASPSPATSARRPLIHKLPVARDGDRRRFPGPAVARERPIERRAATQNPPSPLGVPAAAVVPATNIHNTPELPRSDRQAHPITKVPLLGTVNEHERPVAPFKHGRLPYDFASHSLWYSRAILEIIRP